MQPLPPERIKNVLDAVLVVGEDLDLPRVLERIVEAACELAGARYGALGVLAASGGDRARAGGRRLAQFVTYGLTPHERARIGDLPRGRGILGLLIDDPRPVRLSSLAADPRSAGFPPHHPPMTTFLGVPVRAGGQVFGNLYLTEKAGGGQFTAEDERVVVALASAAGAAVANARLYTESERRRRWVEASAEITTAILGRVDRAAALRLVAERAREVSGAELAALVIEDDDGRLVIEVAVGAGEPLTGQELPRAGIVADILEAASPRAVQAVVGDAALDVFAGLGAGPAVLVPVAGPQGRDMLLVVASRWDQEREFGAAELEPARSFAAQAVLALDRAQAEEDRAALAVLEDRDRIARDLHDLVIQRLFATGLQLQGASRLASRPEARERIEAAVEDLDATIRDIRASIFALHRRPDDGDLRGMLADLVAESAHGLGFVPVLAVEGPVQLGVPDDVRSHLMAVLREALANAARHARATRVDVQVSLSDGWLVASVRDDGTGLAPGRRESGLANLRERAKACGGALEVTTAPGGGTLLVWRVPVS